MTGDPDPSRSGPLPKVTPFLLRRADDLCARRLDHEFRGEPGNADPVHRGRLRDAFLAAALDAHERDAVLGPWRVAGRRTPEENAALEQAIHWYRHLFGDRSVRVVELGLDRPTEAAGFTARLGGWVDLVVVGDDGVHELRQFDLWAGDAPDDVLTHPAVRSALVRIAARLGDPATESMLVSWTDLLRGVRREARCGAAGLAAARAAVHAGVDLVVARTAHPGAEPGADCATCRFRKGCPEFPGAKTVRAGRRDPLPGVLTVTPTALESWTRCARLWRDQHLLGTPPSDVGASGAHGQRVHALLRALHRDGPCEDPARLDEIVLAHGADRRVLDELRNHARRCPVGATTFGHEFTQNRLHSRPPHFLGSARLDAAWIRDGVLDVRDYKTGGVWHTRVADDPRARLQAWVMAPVAERLGLALRVRYEHLSSETVDDPEEWEPDADDLAGLEEWLVATVTAVRSGAPWGGVAEPDVCRSCRYRSVCTDSAAPGVATWPRVDADDLGTVHPDDPRDDP
ncbi:MAG: PD-(D/E)XK nuclease family protein [Actinomycetes bacterium]